MSDSTELARLVGKLEAACERQILARDKRIAELGVENKALRELWLEWDSIDEKEIDSWEAKMRELVKPPKESSSD